MYNQVSRGPHFGPGGSHPAAAAAQPQHAYQQQAHPPPPPPPHFQQGAVPPGPHVYQRGPPTASSTGPVSLPFQAPHSVVQSSGQYGNTMPPQNFASHGQNLQNYSNLGGQSLHAHLPVPPPPHGHSHQEISWPPGPPSRVLPPPPPPPPPPASSQGQVLYKPPFLPPPPPPQPGGSQNVQHSHNTLPPPPPPGSGLLALTPDGVYQHSNDGNYQVPSVAPPPPLPSSPPPVPPSPPPPTPPMASAFSNAAHSYPNTGKVSGPELKAVNSVDKLIGSHPSGIAPLHNSDPNQESGTCRDVAAADRDKQLSTESAELRPQAVDTTELQYHLHVATENADSDMEMEDDITLSDKDHAPNYEIDAHNQQQHRVGEEFSINENVHQLQNLKENDPAKDILSKGPEHLSDLGDMKSAQSVAKVNSPVNDSSEVAEFPLGTVFEKSAALQNGTSDLIEATNPDRDSGQLVRSGSPIRLLQDYASEDASDNEETCGTDANILTVSIGVATGVSVAHKDSGSYLETDIGSKSPSSTQKGFGQLSKTALNDSEISQHLEQESRRCIEDKDENQVSVAASIEAFQGKEALGGTSIESGSKSGNVEQEYVRKGSKFEVSVLKVDEFGRHLREAPTDSDSESDDSHYRQTRRVNKRGRSRSRSPLDRSRHWRRKSPRRRKGKRSQSRSWSPRHRRSRSRSPILKRTGDFGGENVKRDRGQCFNFFRGKCYRGASCRYSHHEPDKNASLRHSRNKHDQEVYSWAKTSRMNKSMKNISPEVSDHVCDGIRNQDVDPFQNVTGQVEKRKEDSFRCAVVSTTSNIDSQSVSNNPIKSESFREATPEMQETLVLREEPNKSIHENDSLQKAANSHQPQVVDGFCPEALGGGDTFKPSSGTYEDIIFSEDGSFVHQIQPNVSIGVSEHSGYTSQLKTASIVSDSSSDKILMISPGANKASSCEPSAFMLPSTQPLPVTSSVGARLSSEQPLFLCQASNELTPHCSSSAELPLPAYQLPPPVVSLAHNENVVHLPQSSRDYGETQQSASLPFQSTTREKIEPYPAPLHTQNPHFSVPPNYSWTSLPPPPPPPSQTLYNSSLNSRVTKSHVSSEFNQSQLHLRADFVSQTSCKPGLPSHSQTPEFRAQAYPPMQDHSWTSVPNEAFSPKHLPQGNPASQLLSGPNLSREELYKQFPVQDSKFSSSVGLHPQQKQYSWQSDVNRLQPSFGGKLPPEDHFKMSPHIHPSSQKQQSMFNFQYSASEGSLGVPGETVTVSRYPTDVLDSNHSTSLQAIGGSRISAHYNPYASTFEQPLSSKFTSSIFRQESEIIHGNSYGSYRLNPTINREGIDGVGSRQLLSSPKSARAVGQSLLRSDDKQYDPLFDSIEPAFSSLKKYDFEQKQEVTGESNISLRPKSSYMSLDVEEQNKQEEVGAVASTTSQNNDEYGETEEAEVGDVDNESLSNHVDVANISTGDIEINQIKSPGKRKKSKDSRSMKLFKVSIANFVKDVLKPSWRQGNMSKVAFKTIVKKTVDKVSGAMKGHRIPKSQAKISQYIDSSQRKLTKLVMGYVDKYVKV